MPPLHVFALGGGQHAQFLQPSVSPQYLSPPEQVHDPLVQPLADEWQAWPQVPQLAVAVSVSTQPAAPQHVCPDEQVAPQDLQFCSSWVRSTHAELQQVLPVAVQLVHEAPQAVLSLVVFLQTEPHRVCGDTQAQV